MKSLAAAIALTAMVTTNAHAGLISTSLIFFSPAGVDCSVTNVGTGKVRVNSVNLIDEFGQSYDTHTLTRCNFPGDIFPHLGCVQYTTTRITGSQFVRCEVNVSGNGRTLRVNLVSLSTSVGALGTSEGR